MNIGTRIHHRRYGWMVGTVTLDATRDRVYVAWDCERYWNANDALEDISDLRPCPYQPRYHHGDGDLDLPVIDHERTDRCPFTR